MLQDLSENSEKNSKEDETFQETEWVDLLDGYNSKLQKKVNVIFYSYLLFWNIC